MKAIAKRFIGSEMAEELINEIIDNFMNSGKKLQPMMVIEGVEGKMYGTGSDWTGASQELLIFDSLPGYPGRKGVELISETCGGYEHVLTVFREGMLLAEHNGARNSCCADGFHLIPDLYWDHFADVKGWRLVELKTSEPDWAVPIALIKGQFGNGPINHEEFIIMELQEKIDKIISNYKKIGIELNLCIGKNDDWEYTILNEDGTLFRPPTINGLQYARFKQNGGDELTI